MARDHFNSARNQWRIAAHTSYSDDSPRGSAAGTRAAATVSAARAWQGHSLDIGRMRSVRNLPAPAYVLSGPTLTLLSSVSISSFGCAPDREPACTVRHGGRDADPRAPESWAGHSCPSPGNTQFAR